MSRGYLYCTNPWITGPTLLQCVMQMLSFDCFIMNLQVIKRLKILTT